MQSSVQQIVLGDGMLKLKTGQRSTDLLCRLDISVSMLCWFE